MRIRFFRDADKGGGGAGGGGAGDGKGGGGPQNLLDMVGDDGKGGGGKGNGGGDAGGLSRPDWLAENFFKPEARELKPDDLKLLAHIDIEGLARSQADLRTKFGRGEHKPPAKADDYTFEMPKDAKIEIKADDPLFATVKGAAHAAGLSNADFNKFLAPVMTKIREIVAAGAGGKQLTEEQKADAQRQADADRVKGFETELQKLGPTGKEAVRQVGTWIKGLGEKGVLTGDEVSELSYLSTAAGITAMQKIMAMSGEKPVPIDPTTAGIDLSIDDARKLMTQGFAEGAETDGGKAKIDRARKALAHYEKLGALTTP